MNYTTRVRDVGSPRGLAKIAEFVPPPKVERRGGGGGGDDSASRRARRPRSTSPRDDSQLARFLPFPLLQLPPIQWGD